ncbi:MAG: methyl-accepting chemotaxis protein [Candidatus Omnitrophota bacterium]
MTIEKTFRRKTFIIKKGLQLRYIGLVFTLAFLASIVAGYTVFTTGWTLFGEKLANVYPQGRLIYTFRAINLALLRNLLFVSPLIFILGLLFSHKIAGPVYRIEKSLHEITKGNLALRIKLRKGDELGDLAYLLNAMTESLNNSISLNKEVILNLQKEIEDAKKVISKQPLDIDLLQASLNNLHAKIEEMKTSLSKWTTTPA